MINLEHVKKHFGANHVLEDVSFNVAPGEHVSLIGPGGCGKTIILKLLLGLLEPDSGKAMIDGVQVSKVPPKEREAILKRVGMAFQQGALFDFRTVRENMEFAMKNMTDYSSAKMDEVVKDLLLQVKLPRTEHMFPFELSGGMQRRVGIARALCVNPEIAIFDEPTSGLDPVTSTIIMNMIKELGGRNKKACLLVATTNVEVAVRFSERVIIINDGKVAADGKWKDLLLHGSDWVKHFLGVRFIGLDIEYAKELKLPAEFIAQHWSTS